MPPISLLIKPASGNCNMKCTYCFYCDEQKKRSRENFGIMSDKTLQTLMRKVFKKAEGMCSIAFQGGEPTLAGLDFYHRVIEYEKMYNRGRVRVQYALQTNGAALTEEWCRFFKEHDFLIGLSVDGTEEIHNHYRKMKNGEDSYGRIVKSVALLEQYQVDYNILTVVHREVAENIEDIYKAYREKGWNYQQYIACLDPLFETPGNQEYSLTPKAYGEFLTRLFDCWYKDYREGKQPYNRQFENYIGILLGAQPEACDQRGCCSVQYVVEADGGVYPCDFFMLDAYLLGNINVDSMNCIDRKREEIGFLERSMRLPEKCTSCSYRMICRGGCMRYRQLSGELGYQNYFCESYKYFFEKCLPRMKLIAEDLKNRYFRKGR